MHKYRFIDLNALITSGNSNSSKLRIKSYLDSYNWIVVGNNNLNNFNFPS